MNISDTYESASAALGGRKHTETKRNFCQVSHVMSFNWRAGVGLTFIMSVPSPTQQYLEKFTSQNNMWNLDLGLHMPAVAKKEKVPGTTSLVSSNDKDFYGSWMMQ